MLFHYQGDQTVEQVVQRGCQIFILGAFQNTIGLDREQLAQGDTDQSRGLH